MSLVFSHFEYYYWHITSHIERNASFFSLTELSVFHNLSFPEKVLSAAFFPLFLLFLPLCSKVSYTPSNRVCLSSTALVWWWWFLKATVFQFSQPKGDFWLRQSVSQRASGGHHLASEQQQFGKQQPGYERRRPSANKFIINNRSIAIKNYHFNWLYSECVCNCHSLFLSLHRLPPKNLWLKN